jgi:BirA family biotin operon repressor/biotin-[acetyl-CoA-carboxylase] ligase
MNWNFDEEVGFVADLSLDTFAIAQALETVDLVRRIFAFEEIDSTSRWLARFADKCASSASVHGVLVVADYQTAGKGRHERPWLAPRGKALLFSLGLSERPKFLQNIVAEAQSVMEHYLSLIVPLAVVEAVREETNLDLAVKFPNDVVIRDRKLAGILIEKLSRFGDAYAVGIGLNVNQDRSELPEKTHLPATSLTIETGKTWARTVLLERICKRLDWWWSRGDLSLAVRKMNEVCRTVGREVRVDLGDELIEGTAMGISEQGALVVRTLSGTLRELYSGDIVELSNASTL